MAWSPSTEDLLDLNGVRRRCDTFRFELLDRDEQVIGEIHPDRSRPPTMTNQPESSIPRRLRNVHIPSSEMQDINVVSDRLRVWMQLQNGEEFSLGIFLWGDDSRAVRSWPINNGERFSSLVDKNLILNQEFIGSFGWGAGAGGTGGLNLAMVFILLQVLELSEFGEPDNPDELQWPITEPVSWPPGTTYYRALTDLADMAGMAPPFFNRDGKVLIIFPPDPAETGSTVDFTYGGRIVANSIIQSDDLLEAPNVFGIYDSGPDNIIVGRFELDDSAPHSIANRGFPVAMVESRQGLESTAQARQAARGLSRSKGVAFDWLEFETTADPRLDTWDVVGVQLEEDGEVEGWLSVEWSLTLRSGGLMSHKLRKVHSGS